MRGRATRWLALTLFVALVAGAAIGCGEGGSTGGTETAEDPLAGAPPGPTREFIVPGGDNVIQIYGREASASERKQTSAVVEAWLRARVAGEWARACSLLDEKTAAYAQRAASSVTEGHLTSCPKAFAILTRQAGPARDNIEGGVASLRVDSGLGFAQYHGKEGRDWILAVHREDGSWKVANLYPVDRLK